MECITPCHHRLATDVTSKSGVRKITSTWGCIREVYVADGVVGVYKGFGVALFGVVIFKALFMGGYDIAKSMLDLDSKSSKTGNGHIAKRFFLAQVGV
jgi:solute carrier family 25 (adenine nucleotide translocator) protein 4/5/6/31